MPFPETWLLVGTVFAVGVLHTLVPDHWVPIAVFARQQRWSSGQTARAALGAGVGHTLSTLAIGLLIWIAGVVIAEKFGHYVALASSLALIAFGGWIAVTSLREARRNERERHHERLPAERSSSRMALMLILGSSPMLEGIPAFLAAARFGARLIVVMSIIFALSTITTYVVLCVYSSRALERMSFGPVERYAEVLSGTIVAMVGVVFLFWPL